MGRLRAGRIKYKKELIAGQNVYIESQIEEGKEKVLITHHTMLDGDGNVAAECRFVGGHLDTVKRKSIALANHVAAKAKERVQDIGYTV